MDSRNNTTEIDMNPRPYIINMTVVGSVFATLYNINDAFRRTISYDIRAEEIPTLRIPITYNVPRIRV